MPLYLDTRGKASAAVAICSRCSQKHPIGYFVGDRNIGPSFRVCPSCSDNYDPWRLPARRTENITLQYPRPDEPLTVGEDADLTYAILTESGFPLLTEDGLTLEIEH